MKILDREGFMKRFLALFLLLALMLASILPAAAEEELSLGARGESVFEMQKRLRELRYLGKGQLTKSFNETTEQALKEFQQHNGLVVTGILDETSRAILFSATAVPKPYPTMPPLATPAPLPEPDWPERDTEGFLAGGQAEYYYENDDAGRWIYLGSDLQIYITRRTDSTIPLIWFETEILTRGGETFRTALTNPERPGKKYQYPYVISRNERFVLGFTDDFFADRMAEKQTVGVVIRGGRIISEKTLRESGSQLPNLDMLAQFPDGRLAVYRCNEITAQELIDLGAVNVFSFGPILIRDGKIDERVYTAYRSTEPRQALGMIAPNHYFLLSVQGRIKKSKGTQLQRVAEIMQAHGVSQALNLDGGNTMALIFRGRMLNKLATYKKKTFVRTVTSLIGIGYTDNQSN